jgi:hypothetical protein
MWVGEVGLNASATRFYDGSTMRWMTRDWIRESGGINGYAYANGNPLNGIDPEGLRDVDVYIWRWEGIPGPGGGRVGHVMVTEANSTQVILSQFPHQISQSSTMRGPNWTYSYDETFNAEGSLPDNVFRVHVSDDVEFDAEAASQRQRIIWDWFPSNRDETHCARSAYDSLLHGGVGVYGQNTGQILPGTLGNILGDLSVKEPFRVRTITPQRLPTLLTPQTQ